MDTAVSYVRVLRLLESSGEEVRAEPLVAPETLPHMPAAKMTTGMAQPIQLAPKEEAKEEAGKETSEISSTLCL